MLEAALRKLGNRYKYVKSLGEGGFSNVYLIKDSTNNMEYALKIMDYDYLQQILKKKKPTNIKAELNIIKQRFIKEASFYKKIDHPYIVKILTVDVIEDVGRGIEVPYLITHFIDGKSLKKIIEDNGPLDFKTALKISENILSVLNSIHHRKVIHRDIKPGNIMIDNKTGEAILIDFGLAKDKLGETTLTISGQILGTPAYMSPEQCRGLKGLEFTTDIYSFGVVLYEMLAGNPPFKGDGYIDLCHAHQEKQVPNIMSLNPGLPQGIEKIIYKAMAKEPKDRYQKAGEMLSDLEKIEQEPKIAKTGKSKEKQDDHDAAKTGEPKRKIRKYFIYLIGIFAVLAALLLIYKYIPSSGTTYNYKENFDLATRAFEEGKFDKAEFHLSEAGKIKTTTELNDLYVRMQEKKQLELAKQLAAMNKDFQALEAFLKGKAGAKDKIAECRKFLDKYKNIPQNDETKLIISEVNQHVTRLEQYEKHIADAQEYLKNGELNKAYESLKWAKDINKTPGTVELEDKLFKESVSALEAHYKEAKYGEAEENYRLAKAIKPDSDLRDLEKKIEFLKGMPADVKAIHKKGIKIEQNKQKLWEADFGNGIVMVYIPPGPFIMGSSRHPGPEEYWMGKTEVSVVQYRKFLNEKRSNYPEWMEKGSKFNLETGSDDHYKNQVYDNYPVVGISWHDAKAYCDWLSGKTGLTFQLPTEEQWEKAARGTDGRMYPWGGTRADNTLANFFSQSPKTVEVNSYPQGASPYGLLNMAGNVEEWCGSEEDPESPVARGGGFYSNDLYIRCTARIKYDPSTRNNALGFRLCLVTKER